MTNKPTTTFTSMIEEFHANVATAMSLSLMNDVPKVGPATRRGRQLVDNDDPHYGAQSPPRAKARSCSHSLTPRKRPKSPIADQSTNPLDEGVQQERADRMLVNKAVAEITAQKQRQRIASPRRECTATEAITDVAVNAMRAHNIATTPVSPAFQLPTRIKGDHTHHW